MEQTSRAQSVIFDEPVPVAIAELINPRERGLDICATGIV